MLDCFKRLFTYNHWANSLLIEHLEKLPDLPPKALDRMSHVVLVENLWRARAEGSTYDEDVFAVRPLEDLSRLNDGSHDAWQAFLVALAPGRLDAIVSYRRITGEPMATTLSDILAHVVNHGTHHRGQIVASIRDIGESPPALDLAYYVRQDPI